MTENQMNFSSVKTEREVFFMTKRLYDQSAYIRSFDALVLLSEQKDGETRVVLDQTAFFPEQGGQYADRGTLGGANVLDVQLENGIIYHTVDRPLQEGEAVHGEIDWKTRFDRMQNHTGEHIVSGYLFSRFGYENTGFHLNDTFLTMDTSGELTKEQLAMAEDGANEAVFADLPVTVSYPTTEELRGMQYRSKLDLTENVRIVTIPGVDACACCAPHVAHTGEVGLIKIVDAIRYKGGMRLTLKCGMRALSDYRIKQNVLTDAAAAMCTKPEEAADGVARLQNQLSQLKNELIAAKRELIAQKIEHLPVTEGNLCFFESDADNNMLRSIVNAGLEKCTGICAAFSEKAGGGYSFVIGSKTIALRAHAKEITSALGGRGGGSDQMLSGTVLAPHDEIIRYIEQFRG